MANEFIARNGLIALNNTTITGSLNISSSVATQFQVGTNLLLVSSSGNVGIGTTTPGFKLDVNGSISGTSLNANFAVVTTRASKADFYGFTGPTLSYYNGVSIVPALTVNPNGNITINTSTDNGYKLQVFSSGTDSGSLFIGGTTIATGSIARTMLISSSLSASANGDTLIGLEINPTYALGAFTGVGRVGLISNGISRFITPNTSGTGLEIQSLASQPQINFNQAGNAVRFTIRLDGGGPENIKFIGGLNTSNFQWYTNSTTQLMQLFSTGNFLLQNGGTFTDNGYKLQLNSSGSISGSLYVSGSASQTLLRVDSDVSSSILFISGSGNIGVGLSNPSYRLDVSGSARIQGLTYLGTGITKYIDASQVDTLWSGPLRVAGSTWAATTLGQRMGVGFYGGPSARLQVQGEGATSATTTFIIQNSTPTILMTVLDNGQFIYTTPTMSLAASQSAYTISPVISGSSVIGANYYAVNITPTFFQTTASQNETAFRVAATFTQSSAAATGGTNVIADFGATSIGSQLTVTDITSGSIYMVNDVSGLPIIEATSDWTVNMYNFPTKVFQKTGSQIIISGSLWINASGSFSFPLTSSVNPPVGSAFWSGSSLYIYDGLRYKSASFA